MSEIEHYLDQNEVKDLSSKLIDVFKTHFPKGKKLTKDEVINEMMFSLGSLALAERNIKDELKEYGIEIDCRLEVKN